MCVRVDVGEGGCMLLLYAETAEQISAKLGTEIVDPGFPHQVLSLSS